MTDEPYRWLEAIGQRREYVESRLHGGSPILAACLHQGLLLLGVGTGQSKVFEIFDRHAMAGIGHPADLERLRQSAIDAAHLEAFTRAPEDVSLRRLVSFGIAPTIKVAFEQLFSPPFLARTLFVELGATPTEDTLAHVDFDGTFAFQKGGCRILAEPGTDTGPAEAFLATHLRPEFTLPAAAQLLLSVWTHLTQGDALTTDATPTPRLAELMGSRTLEAGFLARSHRRAARYLALTPEQLGLAPSPAP